MLMKDLFNIEISHQTVMNYAEASASLLQNLVINYHYNLGHILCGDETYIKVLGKTKYVFFFSDPETKIITAWRIYDHRDTKNAVESILMSLHRYTKIPEDLLIITDANPIYNAAQIFLEMNGIKFNLQQVVGVSNKDEISKTYRPYKQIEERLNRTYKQNYYGTNGYQTLTSANVYMILYVTFFNFLRRHSSLDFKTPVEMAELNEVTLMPDKWVTLINLSKSYIN
jgi:transposase-like protein